MNRYRTLAYRRQVPIVVYHGVNYVIASTAWDQAKWASHRVIQQWDDGRWKVIVGGYGL